MAGSGSPRVAFLLAVACSLQTGAAQLLFKGGMERVQGHGWGDPLGVFWLLAAYGLLGLALMVFVAALRGAALTAVYPVLAARYVWVVAVSPLLFPSESFTSLKIAGAVLAAVGIGLVARTGMR